MNLFRVFCSGALVALPIGLLSGGCGGGSNGLITPTATPLATSTAVPTTTTTATATATALPVQTVAPLRFALSDGRVVTVRLQTQGRRAFGVVETPNASASARRTRVGEPVVPLTWDGGNYSVDGAFTPPLSINLSGEIKQNGVTVPFVFRGTLPTETSPGTFSLTAGGRTVTVTFPAFGGTTATATPQPSATATTAPISFQGTVSRDGLNTGITSIQATGNSKIQHIGNSDLMTGQYTFKNSRGETVIFQTNSTISPRLENRAYSPGSGGPNYDIVLTSSNRRFKAYPGDGTITFLGTRGGVLSFRFDNIAFTENGGSAANGFFSLTGTGTLTDAR